MPIPKLKDSNTIFMEREAISWFNPGIPDLK
jgi:hypothetical protein